MLADVVSHFRERSAGEEDFVHALALHCRGIVRRDGSPATAKDSDVASAFAQQADNFRKELNMAAVVTGNANGPHVFLDRRADNIAD